MTQGAHFAHALRQTLTGRSLASDGYEFLDATAADGSVVVTFRYRTHPAIHAIEVDVTAPLEGPSTGEPCATVEEWAWEVCLLLDEEVGTRDLERHPRTVTPDGVVVVQL